MDRTLIVLHYSLVLRSLPFKQDYEVRRVAIYESPSSWQWRSQDRDYWNLWVAIGGKVAMTVGEKPPVFLQMGGCILIPPETFVSGHSTGISNVVNFTVHFQGWLPGMEIVADRKALTSGVQADRVLWLEPLCEELVWLFAQSSKPENQNLGIGLHFLLRSLLAGARSPKMNPRERAIREAMAAIRRNPRGPWLVEDMAKYCSMSVSHFSKLFGEITGLSPNQFLIRERVQQAAILLRESSLSIAQIAENLGYRDVYFFSRQFRRITGETPGSLRQGSISASPWAKTPEL